MIWTGMTCFVEEVSISRKTGLLDAPLYRSSQGLQQKKP